jgi:transposase
MMGKAKKTEPKLFYYSVSLEQRVSKEHPLRKIKQLVNFDFIRSQVADSYGVNGNQSVDPAVILKLMFLLFYENIKSERALMRQLPLRMDWLWFCGYDLDEETPDHSVLSKARRRWGTEVFERFFMNILEQCINAGLVDGETIFIDSSTIDGNVDINKVRPQLRQVSTELIDKLDETLETDPNHSGQDDNEPDKLAKHVNPVDPEARIGHKYGKSTLGFKDHRVIDDKHAIITTTITTPANLNDDKVLKQAVQTHEVNTETQISTVTADKIYGTVENYKFLHNKGSKACIPHQRHGIIKVGKFSHDKFKYDPQQDCYICPAGEKLKLYDRTATHSSGHRYRAKRQTCEKCKLFEQCVTSKKFGRQVSRNLNAEYIEWADSCLSKYHRKQLLARRKYKAEGSFAHAANNYGFKRARWRGLAKMQIQNLLIAAIQNLGKLLRFGGVVDRLTATATSIKSFFACIGRALRRLFGINAGCERILNYQRANPVYSEKIM